MAFLDTYEIEVKLNDALVEAVPTTFSFSMHDSIHNFFSDIIFNFSDISGVLQDLLLFSEGIKLDIKYGIKDSTILKNTYSIINDELNSTYANDTIGGSSVIKALNRFYDMLEIKSEAYNDRISNVIVDLMDVPGYTFADLTWNDTGNQSIWYRPLMNQKDFIEKILLPNAYSNNAADTPFFAYIDSNNEFNLRNYYSMISTTPKEIFELKNVGADSITSTSIIGLKRMKTGSLYNKKLRNRKLYSRNTETGEMEEETDFIYNYPSGSTNHLPIKKDDLDSDYFDLLYEETEIGKLESYWGRTISSMKDTFFLERFILTTVFNPNLRAGDLIELRLPIKLQGNSSQLAENMSGFYLVEDSEHIWDGIGKNARSKLIVSRKFLTISNNSLLKPQFMKGA
jgi:hypothetical protein